MLTLLYGIIAFVICLYVYSRIIFPLFYFLPQSIFYIVKGKMRAIAILMCFVSPVIWLTIILIAGFLFPTTFDFITSNVGVAIGSNFAIGAIILRTFSQKGRDELMRDYWVAIGQKCFTGERDDYAHFLSKFI